jgi:iron complex outermembrane receptor protein
MKKFVCISAAAFCCLIGTTQEPESVELDPVSVSASLSALQTSRTGRNIIVFKGDQLAQLPVHSVDELLRYLPGVEIQARGPQGAQSDIVLRGGTFNQVLVIIDGLRLNDPNTGHFSTYVPIAPAEIERIEVLKGASSAIYGSDAVGGVVHIITKSFAAQKESRFGASQQITVGEWGLKNIQTGAFYSDGKLSLSGGILSTNADGQPQRGIRGYFHNTTASLSAGYRFNEFWHLGIRTAYDTRDFAAQNYYTTFASDTAFERVATQWNGARLLYQKGSNRFLFSGGYKAVTDEFFYTPAATPNNNLSKLYQALAFYEHQFNKATSLTGGAQIQNRTIKSNDRGNHAVKQLAGFLIVNQAIGEALRINPALRIDWDERAGTELVPQINVSYRSGIVQLRGSAGKTIRQATFTERFNNYNKARVASGSIGNPDLAAERSFSFEAGADVFASKNVRIAATYFQRNQRDLVDFVTTPFAEMPRQTNLVPGGTYALARNVSKVATRGFETDFIIQKPMGTGQQIWAMAGLVWLRSATDETRDMFYVKSHAKFLANFNVRYNYKAFSMGITGVYKVREPRKASAINAEITREYLVLNGLAEASVYDNTVRVFVQVDNFLNTRYSDLLGAPMPRRWLMGGIKIAVGK